MRREKRSVLMRAISRVNAFQIIWHAARSIECSVVFVSNNLLQHVFD